MTADTPAGPAPGPVPAEAITLAVEAAASAVARMLGHPDASLGQYHRDFARMVLDAAWPVLAANAAATERERIHRQLAGYRFHDECKRGDDCPNVYHVRLVLPAAGDAIVTRYRPGGADLLDGDTR
jgi:hypothetical protein